MFVISMKPNRKKIILSILFAVIVILSLFILFRGESVKTSTDNSVSVNAKTNEERLNYLKTYGWKVKEEPCEIVEVAIPLEFGDVYKKYVKIQKAQGFELEPYQGKRVKRYSYEVTNYPNDITGVRANVLVYNGNVIGGDICSVKLDGFMHGFALPK